MTSKCLSCFKGVTSRSKALQCTICDGWTHIACCGVGHDLYEFLLRSNVPGLGFFCDLCRVTISNRRCLDGLPALSPLTSPAQAEMNIAAVPLPTPCLITCDSGAATPTSKRSRAPSTTSTETPAV
ncbi:unnamed protein product, partial [Dicrocoelium dendriticum]